MYKDTPIVILHTVSCHNFNSQNLKSSVSNPKSKYVAHLSVLSQISNCQSLGRKNKHQILKTDRTLDLDNYNPILVLIGIILLLVLYIVYV